MRRWPSTASRRSRPTTSDHVRFRPDRRRREPLNVPLIGVREMAKSSLSASSLSARVDVAHGSIGTKAARSAAAITRKGELAIATPAASEIEERDDHFVVRNGVRCAGAHLIIDLYGAERLDDIDHIEAALR